MARKTVLVCDSCGMEVGEGKGATLRLTYSDARRGAKVADLCDGCAGQLPGRAAAPRPGGRGARIAGFADLAVGDIVVHEDHGIARFSGYDTKTVAGITRDYLTLEYRGEDKVFLPAEQLHKISRYFGASGPDGVTLSKLGGKAWETLKSRARKAAHALAGRWGGPVTTGTLKGGHVGVCAGGALPRRILEWHQS